MLVKEKRVSNSPLKITRSEDNSELTVVGLASVYNKPSKLIAENGKIFNEVIERGAFDNALRSEGLDVIATINHDPDKMIARTMSGTLRLESVDEGLQYTLTLPNTTVGRDAAEMLQRGDLYESSFIAYVDPKAIRWDRSDGSNTRVISNFTKLVDVSIVTRGAYATTDVAVRAASELEAIELAEREAKEQKTDFTNFIQKHKNESK